MPRDPDSPSGATAPPPADEHGEVSTRIAVLLFDGAASRGIGHAGLIEGTGLTLEQLRRPGGTIPWSSFVRLMANASERFSPDELAEMGREAVNHPVFRTVVGAARILFTPLDLFRWIAPDGRDMLITCLTNSLEELGGGRVVLDSRLDEGREPCPGLYYTAQGVFEQIMVPMGYGPAKVSVEVDARGGRFTIEVPRGRALLPWLRRWVMLPWTLRVAGRDLRDANDILSERQRELAARLVELETERTARRRAELERHRYREHLEALLHERTSELELSRAVLDTKQRLASLGTLAAGIAHQLNNPLGSILNAAEFAQLSRDDADFREVALRTLDDIRSQAQRGGRIVHSVLKFSQGEATEKWVQNVDETIERACRLVRSDATAHGANIRFEHDDAPALVDMNPLEIEQALVNLLDNAIQSGDSVEVEVRRVASKDQIDLFVVDDGRGIDPEDLPHVLDPFFTRRLAEGGTGLGLSVAHGIVAEHGGRLSFESTPGKGTTARLELPRAGGPELGEAPRSDAPQK